MAYSKDLRERVLSFIASGGGKQAAANMYKVHVSTIQNWLKQPADHQARKPGPTGSRKFDRAQLVKLVQERPDMLLKEIAIHFNVSVNSISHALKVMGIRRKKNSAIRSSLQTTEHHQA